MSNWPHGGYAAGNTPASELKPPPPGMVSKEHYPSGDATYTAAEVKVLTETATRLGREIGRKEALDEAADLVDALSDGVANREKPYNEAFIHACSVISRHILDLSSQPAGAVSDEHSGEDT